MASFTTAEKVDMVFVYGAAQKDAKAACTLYAERYPGRRHPSHTTLWRIVTAFTNTGSVTPKPRHRQRHATNEGAEVAVLAAVAQNPYQSIRQLAGDTGITQTSVYRILHQHHFHPYHVSLHQELDGNDFENRVNFCHWAQQQIALNDNFVPMVLFSDEATFTNHGQINRHNMHYWATENPLWLRQVERQRPWSVNVWCGILGTQLIGPYFIDGVLNGQRYSQFLDTILPQLLEDVPLHKRIHMWFQHDGCPAHNAHVSQEILNRDFPNRWIGRGGPVTWPARSPDLTAPDFFLWGFLKGNCYKDVATTRENMQQRIVDACASIKIDTLQQVTLSFQERIAKCIQVNGHHFEHLLK